MPQASSSRQPTDWHPSQICRHNDRLKSAASISRQLILIAEPRPSCATIRAKLSASSSTCFPVHDPEKWVPVFRKDHAQTKEIERDDDSKKSHHALVLVAPIVRFCAITHRAMPAVCRHRPSLAIFLNIANISWNILRQSRGTLPRVHRTIASPTKNLWRRKVHGAPTL
jgi:hypothetical protein